jgi:hypothetical protein
MEAGGCSASESPLTRGHRLVSQNWTANWGSPAGSPRSSKGSAEQRRTLTWRVEAAAIALPIRVCRPGGLVFLRIESSHTTRRL